MAPNLPFRPSIALSVQWDGEPPFETRRKTDVANQLKSKSEDTIADETLDRLRRIGGNGLTISLIDRFFEQAPGLMDSIRSAVEADDWVGVRKAAQALKSSAGVLGAVALCRIAQRIEEAARSDQASRIPALLPVLELGYESALRRLELLQGRDS